ncbi:hypothetical protein [Chryseobacterium carnipullorum]|uniref:hypothetical protein n=1 Tax=Chryseobacterium carnipullorum TaxID=1124835 RepID=UPI0015F1BBC3|nr:hypothetical protein [Chryseobacterium carnipullorum]
MYIPLATIVPTTTPATHDATSTPNKGTKHSPLGSLYSNGLFITYPYLLIV